MTGAKHILISQVCCMNDSQSNEFLVDESLLQVYSTERGESKIIIVDESSKEGSKS